MAGRVSPLRLGARVCFEDRWQGRVTGCDVDERWEVLNVVVASGFLLFKKSVKLPFSAVTRWGEDGVFLNVISFRAFAREVPPIAAPARPLDGKTPVSHPGAHFAGLLVDETTRRATGALISRGLKTYRVPIGDAPFEGKTLALSQQIQNFPEYRPDHELIESIRGALREDKLIPSDEKQAIEVDVNNGIVTLRGNVRVSQTAELVGSIVARAEGVVDVRNQIVDDISLESDIGLVLDRAGVQRTAEVHARANLGEVVLYGTASSPAAVDDIARTVGRIPGVRDVVSRLGLRAPASSTGRSLASA